MGKELKVLMMGGARVGKSSALAAIMDSFVHGEISRFLTASDKTHLVEKNGKKQTSIEGKLQDVKTMIANNKGRTILVDSGKTSDQWDYKLDISIPGSYDNMSMLITDVNGEFFEDDNKYQYKVLELVKDYDVFIVAIDTPFMMESRNRELVNRVINDKYNCISSIHRFLTSIDDQNGEDAKLVIFAPIKCEKWAQENKLDLVSACVREDYKTSLAALERFESIQIEIIPIQTIGSVVFEEHREAYIYTQMSQSPYEKMQVSKCALLSDDKIRLGNGSEINPKSGQIDLDSDAVLICGTDMTRPNSWFKVQSSEYKPHNCEQLAFHILEFMLSKVIDVKVRKEEAENPFKVVLRIVIKLIDKIFLINLWEKLKYVFGSIPIIKMDSIIKKMNAMYMIKRSGEGILILKKCSFRKF